MDHATDVQRLVSLASAELPGDDQHRMAMDMFFSSLDNAELQRHLWAVDVPIIEAAVRPGNEFCQIQSPGLKTRIQAEGAEPAVAVIKSLEEQMMREMSRIAAQLAQLQESSRIDSTTAGEILCREAWGTTATYQEVPYPFSWNVGIVVEDAT